MKPGGLFNRSDENLTTYRYTALSDAINKRINDHPVVFVDINDENNWVQIILRNHEKITIHVDPSHLNIKGIFNIHDEFFELPNVPTRIQSHLVNKTHCYLISLSDDGAGIVHGGDEEEKSWHPFQADKGASDFLKYSCDYLDTWFVGRHGSFIDNATGSFKSNSVRSMEETSEGLKITFNTDVVIYANQIIKKRHLSSF